MELRTVKGFLIILLIQHCTSEGASASVQDGQTTPQEPGPPAVEVVPVVSPPSLEEVQQVVLEASEQVESRGAEEVLKELLERVVEAAWGQAGGEGATALEPSDNQQGEISESVSEAEAEGVQQSVGNENIQIMGEGADFEEDEVGEKAAVNNVGEEEVAEEGDETDIVDNITPNIETGDKDVDGVEVIASPGPEISREEAEMTIDGTDRGGALKETEEDGSEQVKLMAETETPGKAVTGDHSEQGMLEEPQPVSEQDDVEQIRHEWGGEGLAAAKPQDDTVEGEVIALPLDNVLLDNGQISTEAVAEEGGVEMEEQTVTDVEAQISNTSAAGGVNVERKEQVEMVNMETSDRIEEEGEITLEISQTTGKEDEEVPVLPGPESDDQTPMEQSSESQHPTDNLSLTDVDPHVDTQQSLANDIITPTGNLVPHNPTAAQPALDDSVKDGLELQALEQGEDPGEVNELVEDTRDTSEANELGLEAWKIGAISAAVFLVLATVCIGMYILKCRTKSSTSAMQRACEDGCVEPEAATGADCNDDTLPAGNGDAQQMTLLDPSDVASTLAKTKEQRAEPALSMANLPPSNTDGFVTNGPGQASSQGIQTNL